MKYVIYSMLLFCTTLFCGCNSPRDKINDFDTLYKNGEYDKALTFLEKNSSKNYKGRNEDLLWCLNAGVINWLKHDYEQSVRMFDYAEAILKQHDLGENETGEIAVSAAANETLIPYTGEIFDGIMLNVYKGISFMSLGNNEFARVEFNRAMDRQRRALKQYDAELKKLKDQEKKSGNSIDNQKCRSIVSEHYPDLDKYEVYHDFVNPFATYMAGLFYYMDGDANKAIDYFKEAAGMMPDNDYVQQDLRLAELAVFENSKTDGYVWVIFENGLGPIRKEFRVDLPVIIDKKEMVVSVALPKLECRNSACPNLILEAEGSSVKTRELTSMDRIIQTEFKKDYSSILTRAILSTSSKAVMQYSLRNKNVGFQLGSMAYAFLSTTADTRIWTTLPKNFQLARIEIPGDRKLQLVIPGGNRVDITLDDCKNAIIYAKLPGKNSELVYDVIKY